METKEEFFNKTSENFKKICTANGIDKDALTEFIINTIELIPYEEKLNFLDYLIVEEVLMCTDNIYEALGVLALSKSRYLDIMKIDFDDEDDD
jgi:F0F1-type ATP synthase delta subunit